MDYRRTKYCPELVDIKEKKKKIEALIKKGTSACTRYAYLYKR